MCQVSISSRDYLPNMDEKISIDREEFTRLQTQLIDLRTTNYQSKEDNAKIENELHQLQDSIQTLHKELDKSNKTIQRSKKAREYQFLIEDNDSLLNRLHTQEEDFKLQNKTLMDELANVCEVNEQLKKQVKSKGNGTPELTRLKAENAALQKSFQSLQCQTSTDQDTGYSDQTDNPITSIEVSSLQLSVATLEEEKKLLQEQLTSVEERERKIISELNNEVDRLNEKVRKKQESLVQLQEEKESLISENKKSHDMMELEKQDIITRLQEQLEKITEELEKRNEAARNNFEITHQMSILRTEKEELQLKCNHYSELQVALTKERDGTKTLLDELSRELQLTKGYLGEEKTKCRQFEEEMQEARQASDNLADQLLSVREDKIKLEEEIKAINKLAEKRKSLLDEIAIKDQETASELKKKEDEAISKYQKEIEDIRNELEIEKGRNRELLITIEELNDLKEKVVKFENIKSTHEETLQKIRIEFDAEKIELQKSLEDLQVKYEDDMTSLRNELSTCQIKNEELLNQVTVLEEELDEKGSAVKIVERKSAGLIKDLKRQIQQFQKREEKLQQQISDIKGVDHTQSYSTSITREQSNDDSSKHSRESSLSSIRGIDTASSPNTSLLSTLQPNISTDDVNDDDTQSLLDRITHLQHDKWQLEEKVYHLETNTSVLAEDVLKKSSIIQNYFMENKTDHTISHPSGHNKMSPMRLVQWAKTPGREDTMAEVNRKMQRALEEALMKNIHLQENVEMLSSELHKYTESNKISSTDDTS